MAAVNRLMHILLIAGAISALLLLGLLAWSTNQASRIDRYYPLLLSLNVVVALALGAWVITLTTRLIRQLRRNVFGARLTARLALAFALVGIVPGALIYTLSVEFLSRSIESWFNVRVNAALDAGLNLGRAALDSRLTDLHARARLLALELGDPPPGDPSLSLALTRLRERQALTEAMVFNANGNVIAFSTNSFNTLAPASPPTAILQQLRSGRSYAAIETTPSSDDANDIDFTLRVIVPLISQGDLGNLNSLLRPETRYLQLTQTVPENITDNANQVQRGYRDYQELALSRDGLRKVYGITLTLALLLAAFTAIAAAFALSARLVRPLLRLAAGTQAASLGKFRQLPEPSGRDEVGQLTRSFNAMTRELAEARRMVENNRLQLERSNAYLENVLATLSSGVLVFDADFRLTTFNQGAQRILRTPFQQHLGTSLDQTTELNHFIQTIRHGFTEQAAADTGNAHWQRQIEITLSNHPTESDSNLLRPEPFASQDLSRTTLTLLMRGSLLTIDSDLGYVVVFDDITDVISANRIVAWGEVARRLAHEIKNPLTPIQLSAERLQHKLEHKLEDSDAALLRRATNTIVNQVASMQAMVDEFREYARKPSLNLQETDLNALIGDVLALYGWDAQEAPHGSLGSIQLDVSLADDLPPILCDPTQIRQIVHNLMANAGDAVSQADNIPTPTIRLSTRLASARLSDGAELAAIQITVSDNGPGFAESVLQRAFEPYITTKSKGTGLGLAIVRKIVEEHGGSIEIANRSEGGARVSILLTRFIGALGNTSVSKAPQGNTKR